MKQITQCAVEEFGSGYAVTVRYFVDKNDIHDDYRDLLKHFELEAVLRDTGKEDKDDSKCDQEAQPDGPRPRGRRRNTRNASEDAGTDSEADSDGSGERDSKPTRGRRTRRSAAAGEGGTADDKHKRRGRGRAKKPETTPEAETDVEEISDVDLVAACGYGADLIGSKGVLEILTEEFGVDQVRDIEGEARAEFIERMSELE